MLKSSLLAAALLLAQPADLEARLATCSRTYDLDCARECVAALRDARGQEQLLARALLLVAELQRIEFESLPESEGAARRKLGQGIDTAAQEGLKTLESAPDTSEAWRIRADLYGTMIRTDYQAARYRKKMMAAIDAALKADPANAAAYVSAAKPHLFAKEGQGQDLNQSLYFLEIALALDPKLESAHALRALTWEKMGRTADAAKEWQALLDNNPNCRPARQALERLRIPPG